MINQPIQNSISYPPIGGFLIFYSYNLIFNMNVKMQNKAKFKFAKIPLKFCIQRTNKNALRPPQPKNKPKQTQIKDTVARVSGLNVTQALCHSERSEVLWTERSRRIYLNSHPPTGGFRIFDICAFIFDMFFMTNKPNFPFVKMTVSPFLNKTYDCSLTADGHKNKPKQTQSPFRLVHSILPCRPP
jgi:hypothetical protein